MSRNILGDDNRGWRGLRIVLVCRGWNSGLTDAFSVSNAEEEKIESESVVDVIVAIDVRPLASLQAGEEQ